MVFDYHRRRRKLERLATMPGLLSGGVNVSVVLVHGIFNHVRGATPEEAGARRAAECQTQLARAIAATGLNVNVPDLVMAYYADLLRTDLPEQMQATRQTGKGFVDLTAVQRAEAADWLSVAGAPAPQETQNIGLAPLRQTLGWLLDQSGGSLVGAVKEQAIHRLERLMVSMLHEVEAYTTWPERRQLVRERVAGVILREQPRVVVAHSLGSVVTYETLHAHPELEIEMLLTVGSPLRVPSLARRLEPSLRGGRGARPVGVKRWVNIADVGDIVAVPPKLSVAFPVDQDETTDNGLGFHGLGGYLANGLTAAALAPYLT
ncbi:hypothetical protein [Kitasatospora sp. NPDC090091]|uniref:hypothetical protein n=1 Tax=Kitasatospora sp. NPDC090091 TaxID=3364081 RepID=UPI00382E0E0F